MEQTLKSVAKWLRDERASVLSEKTVVVAIGILGGISLGAIALPVVTEYGTDLFGKFEDAAGGEALGEWGLE